MRTRLFSLALGIGLVIAANCAVANDHAVNGYVKKDGTYVAPYRATNPNGTKVDNYSAVGNVNPYTGKPGTKDPYKPYTPPQ